MAISRREVSVGRHRYGHQYAAVPEPSRRIKGELRRIDEETLLIQEGLLGDHLAKETDRRLCHKRTDAELEDVQSVYARGKQVALEEPAAEPSIRQVLRIDQRLRIERMQG